MTFEDVWEGALRVQQGLYVRAPQACRVALLAKPSCSWACGFWGVMLSGCWLVPLAEVHPVREHARALLAGKADVLLVAREQLGHARAVLAECEHSAARLPLPRLVELETLLEASRPAEAVPTRPDATPGVLFFTSGTTGVPKGALVSDEQLLALANLVGRAWGMSSDDRLAHCLPLHHTHGLSIAFLVCTLAGATVHFLPRFEPERVFEAFERSSVFMGVPTMHKRLLDALDRQPPDVRRHWARSLRHQRLVTSGSAALPTGLALRYERITGSIPLERFGMTEVGVAISNPLGKTRRLGSCGQVLPGMRVRIVDDSGRDRAPGEPGEIWIRGPSVFSGYDADPEATAASFCEGWFRSGDTATWLSDGYIKILGRTSVDIIKSGGYKLSALEIEEALRRFPGIEDAAVVGLPDPDWGERAVAAIVTRGEIALDEINRFLKEELAPYKVPRQLFAMQELPRNVLGKVTKRTLVHELERRLDVGVGR